METMETTRLQHETLSETLAAVERITSDLCDQFNVDEELFGNILVALSEAATNAFVHGNNSSPFKTTTIDYEVKNNRLHFRVSDEGGGFDYDNLPDPLAPENLEKASGRGIFLMRNLADEVSFNESGNEVEIKFNLS